jgi:hypothetical protein
MEDQNVILDQVHVFTNPASTTEHALKQITTQEVTLAYAMKYIMDLTVKWLSICA